jgi:adenosylhomocysteine nucleosidase
LLTGDDFITDPDHLAALAGEGVTALDMETAAVAAVCEAGGVPWSVVRAISDVAGDQAVVKAMEQGLARPDGSPDVAAAARFLARAPWRVGSLTRLARQAQVAARAAAGEAVRAVESST